MGRRGSPRQGEHVHQQTRQYARNRDRLLSRIPGSGRSGRQPALATVKSVNCTFPVVATGTWKNGKPEAAVKPASLTLKFDPVNVDEGTAVLLANDGGTASKSDILVRLSKGTLHFVQMFTDGPLYATTIFPERDARREAAGGPHATRVHARDVDARVYLAARAVLRRM